MELNDVTSSMAAARRDRSGTAFQRSAGVLGRNRSRVREALQSVTSNEILSVLDRLRGGATPSKEDLETVRLWIVGDAESYVRQENNFDDWMAEFERLEGVLSSFEGHSCSQVELLELQGILEDAIRVSHDIANFLEKRERIERFEAAVDDRIEWNHDDREFLIRILTGKLERPEV